MEADKILMEVILDRETHDRIKDATGISATNGTNLMRSVICLLNMHDARKEK